MSILPIKILTSNKRKFQRIALLVDRPEFQEEILTLVNKWRNKSTKAINEQYQIDLQSSLIRLKLPSSLNEFLSECVLSGILWKDYNLSGLEILEILLVRSRKSKTLDSLDRDRDWFWRHKSNESYGEIAKKEKVGRQTIINAIKRYKELTGNR